MSGIMSEEITFADLDLSPEVMDSLKKMGVKRPTTIQQKAIPLMMDNISVIAKAPTGTGKTVTLQTMAESFSQLGVPVFLSDVKGDLSGIAVKSSPSGKIAERIESVKNRTRRNEGGRAILRNARL